MEHLWNLFLIFFFFESSKWSRDNDASITFRGRGSQCWITCFLFNFHLWNFFYLMGRRPSLRWKLRSADSFMGLNYSGTHSCKKGKSSASSGMAI